MFAVPGNHDLPAYSLLERVWNPYRHYRKYISPDLEPVWRDGEVGIVGIKSSRRAPLATTWAIGAIGRRQLERSLARLDVMPEGLVRIVVVHHPLLLPESPAQPLSKSSFTGGAARALAAFTQPPCDPSRPSQWTRTSVQRDAEVADQRHPDRALGVDQGLHLGGAAGQRLQPDLGHASTRLRLGDGSGERGGQALHHRIGRRRRNHQTLPGGGLEIREPEGFADGGHVRQLADPLGRGGRERAYLAGTDLAAAEG